MPEARLRAAPVLRRIASTIRYAARPVVRYGFTISGLPTAWQAGPPGSADSVATFDGRLGNVSWEAGPADEPGALTISVSPTAAPKICDYSGKPNIMVDGVRARMRTDTNKGHKYIQLVCAQGVRGMQLFITLDLSTQGSVPTPLPGGRQVGTIRTVLSHLRLLGPDLADWTTRPQG